MRYSPGRLRKTIVRMCYQGNANHLACAFSIVEIVAVVFESFLGRGEKFYLSKGHGVMALYAALVEKGVLPADMTENYLLDGTSYSALAESHVPGVEVNGGSLGHGICVAAGAALARKRKGDCSPVFCLVGDGELNEGSCWEALLFSAHQKLSNLVVLVDKNGWQAMGKTDEVANLGDLGNKLTAFGFDCLECAGNDTDSVHSSLDALLRISTDRPKALVCHTEKGYGLSFTVNDNSWHYSRLSQENYDQALKELGP